MELEAATTARRRTDVRAQDHARLKSPDRADAEVVKLYQSPGGGFRRESAVRAGFSGPTRIP